MKIIIPLLFVFSVASTYGQGEYNYEYFFASAYTGQFKNPEGIQKLTYEVKTHKNGKVKKYEKEFNDGGKLTSYGFYEDGAIIYKSKNKFDEANFLIQQEYFKDNGKLRTKSIGLRDEDGKLTEYSKFKGEDKLLTYSTWTYNSSACILNSTNYKKNKEEIKRKWSYEYYEECEKKQSTLTNGKGKIIQTWTYDCKAEGEELVKKKDVTQMCKWEESDGKYLIKVTESFNEKGEVYKTISKYNLADTSLIEWKRFNGENEIEYESTYNPDTKKILTYVSYKNGKVRSSQKYKYENGQLISMSRIYKKNTTEYKYEYKENRLMASKFYNKDGELAKTTTYEYN